MEKQERAQDEKDFQEMKKAVPGVTNRVIDKVKADVAADKAAQDARIKKYNDRVLRASPAHRAPEPEKKEEEKDPSKAASDAAVDEMKALKNKDKKKAGDPAKELTVQLNQKRGFTDHQGNAHIHFAQQDDSANQTQNATASAPAPPTTSATGANASASGNSTADSTQPGASKPADKKKKNRMKKEMDKKKALDKNATKQESNKEKKE